MRFQLIAEITSVAVTRAHNLFSDIMHSSFLAAINCRVEVATFANSSSFFPSYKIFRWIIIKLELKLNWNCSEAQQCCHLVKLVHYTVGNWNLVGHFPTVGIFFSFRKIGTVAQKLCWSTYLFRGWTIFTIFNRFTYITQQGCNWCKMRYSYEWQLTKDCITMELTPRNKKKANSHP